MDQQVPNFNCKQPAKRSTADALLSMGGPGIAPLKQKIAVSLSLSQFVECTGHMYTHQKPHVHLLATQKKQFEL